MCEHVVIKIPPTAGGHDVLADERWQVVFSGAVDQWRLVVTLTFVPGQMLALAFGVQEPPTISHAAHESGVRVGWIDNGAVGTRDFFARHVGKQNDVRVVLAENGENLWVRVLQLCAENHDVPLRKRYSLVWRDRRVEVVVR